MYKFKKFSFAGILALLLLLPAVFTTVSAEDSEIVDSGKCGDALTWILSSSGVLTVSGSGDMYDGMLDEEEIERGLRRGDIFPDKHATRINTVIIEEGVTSVGNYAFSSFWIKDIRLPSTLARIGDYAFYRVDIKELDFPQDSQLRNLGKGAFESSSVLKKVNFSNCDILEGISDNCFYDAGELSELVFPESENFKYIGKSAFEKCKKLSQVIVTDGVNSIADRAFAKCTSLLSLSLPETLDVTGDEILDGCGAMAVFGKADSRAQDLAKINNVSFVAGNSADNAVILKQGSCGENVTWALGSDGRLTISGSGEMQTYASASFAPWYKDTNAITSITVEEGITHISREAFAGLARAKNISLPDSLKTIADYAFMGCRDIGEILIPENVVSIGSHAFYYNTGAVRIYIPASVAFIGEYAFFEPLALESFEVSPDNKFFSSDNGVLFNKDKTVLMAYPIGKADTSYTIPAGVTTIDFRAFSEAKNLEEIIFNEGCLITQLESNVFEGCTSLKNVKLHNGLQRIGNRAFASCHSLAEITVPETVTEVGMNAFSDTALKSISLPGVLHIGDRAFSMCEELESVDFPCAQIIGEEAFIHCTKIKDMYIPASVNFIGVNAFLWDTLIEKITVAPENTAYCNDEIGALYTTDMTRLIRYPQMSDVTEYVIPDTVITIDPFAFYMAKNLTKVVLPQSLVSIGNSAFADCLSITEAVLPKTLSSLGNDAFINCTSLESFVIPQDTALTTMGKGVLVNTALSELTIPAPIKTVSAYAVSSENLHTVTVAEGTELSYIGYGAFSNGSFVKLLVPQGSSAERAAFAAGISYSYTDPITVLTDGISVEFDQHPIIENDRVLVPMRAIFEALGAQVTWEHATYTAVATKDNITVRIGIGESQLDKNGVSIPIDSPAKLVSNRTMVPVRAVSEAFGCSVEWDGDTRTVSVTSK